jgi:triacylglycerol lipase
VNHTCTRLAVSMVALLLTRSLGVPVRAAAGPPLTVPPAFLAAALHCPHGFHHLTRNPVLLVHGTTQTAAETWGWNYLKVLDTVGYDVCGVDLPDRALGDMQVASEYVVFAVREMASQTGRKVDMVGHSQGSEELRWALKWWPDVLASVEHYISLAAPDHGDLDFNAMCLHACWPSAWQERVGAAFMSALNAGDETPGDVAYTSIYTLTDQFVEPEALTPTSGLAGGRRIAVQDICPGRVVDHMGMLADAVAYALVLDALTHPGETANPDRIDPTVCSRILMPGVDPLDEVAFDLKLYTATIPAALQRDQVDREPPLASYVPSN